MQIVIEIPEKMYHMINAGFYDYGDMNVIIQNGTPLPKGHGRLCDLDAVMSDISTSINVMTNIGIAVDGEYLWEKLNDAIYNAQTIIEADKESEE